MKRRRHHEDEDCYSGPIAVAEDPEPDPTDPPPQPPPNTPPVGG